MVNQIIRPVAAVVAASGSALVAAAVLLAATNIILTVLVLLFVVAMYTLVRPISCSKNMLSSEISVGSTPSTCKPVSPSRTLMLCYGLSDVKENVCFT